MGDKSPKSKNKDKKQKSVQVAKDKKKNQAKQDPSSLTGMSKN